MNKTVNEIRYLLFYCIRLPTLSQKNLNLRRKTGPGTMQYRRFWAILYMRINTRHVLLHPPSIRTDSVFNAKDPQDV